MEETNNLVESIIIDEPVQTEIERGRDVIKKAVKNMPLLPGVYRMLDNEGNILYVGKAKNLQNRVSSYANINELNYRIKRMVSNVHDVIFSVTETESDAIFLEADLIRTLKPPYNVHLKESTPFVSISISKNHMFPSVAKHRGAFDNKNYEYCGPFSSVKSVDEALSNVYKIFKLRNCSDSYFLNRKRPCLQYDMRRCSAPCINKIEIEEYKNNVQNCKDFLAGNFSYVLNKLKVDMELASENLEFEKAARCRDSIKYIEKLGQIEKEDTGNLKDADVIAIVQNNSDDNSETFFPCVYVLFIRNNMYLGGDAFFLSNDANLFSKEENLESFLQQFYFDRIPPMRILLNCDIGTNEEFEKALYSKHNVKVKIEIPKKGNGLKWVKEALNNAVQQMKYESAKKADFSDNFKKIQEIFAISNPIKRIEIYDNSHLQGTNAYGCFVVATKDGFDKKSYRKFSVSPRSENSDSLIGGDDFFMMKEVMTRRFKNQDVIPDLIFIDGGIGQVTSVLEILRKYNLENIPIVGIAKGPDRNAGNERFFIPGWQPISLPKHDPVLYFIQNLRDESHRFAIGTHKSARSKIITKSQLNEIPGVGKERKKALLKKFNSVSRIKQASIEELCNVEGITKQLAKTIYDFFR